MENFDWNRAEAAFAQRQGFSPREEPPSLAESVSRFPAPRINLETQVNTGLLSGTKLTSEELERIENDPEGCLAVAAEKIRTIWEEAERRLAALKIESRQNYMQDRAVAIKTVADRDAVQRISLARVLRFFGMEGETHISDKELHQQALNVLAAETNIDAVTDFIWHLEAEGRMEKVLSPEVSALICARLEDDSFALFADLEPEEAERHVRFLESVAKIYLSGFYGHLFRKYLTDTAKYCREKGKKEMAGRLHNILQRSVS